MSLFQNISDGAVKASQNRKLITIVLVLVLVFLIRKEIRKQVQANEYDALANSLNAQLAFQIRQACNPGGSVLGYSLIDVDGSEEQKLFVVASQISDWTGVQDSYFRLYGESLVKRLENELGTDFQKFIETIPKAGSTTQPGTNPGTPPTNYLGYVVVSLASMNLYYKDSPTKIAKTVAGGKNLGEWAGEQLINGVPYVIIRTDLLWWTDYYLARKSDVKLVKS
jgi:hypothetical protein